MLISLRSPKESDTKRQILILYYFLNLMFSCVFLVVGRKLPGKGLFFEIHEFIDVVVFVELRINEREESF